MSEIAIPSATAERIAQEFAANVRAGKRRSIEAALDAAPRADWGILLRSLLVAEVATRRSRGETPLLHEYLPRFPAHTDVVRAVLSDNVTTTLRSHQTVHEIPVAPLPIPLVEPIVKPLPLAIQLPTPSRPESRRGGRRKSSRTRKWAAGGLAVVVLAIVVGLSVPPGPSPNVETAPASRSNQANATPSRTPARIHSKRPPEDPERDLADWVTAIGGSGTMVLATGGRRTFGEEVPLPQGKFAVTSVSLPPDSAGLWSEADFDRLRGRSRLTSLRLHHPTALTGPALEPLAGLPLTVLELYGDIRVAGPALARFPDLESLALVSAFAFTDTDLADVATLSKLRSFAIDTYHLTPKGLAGLRNPGLRSLAFGEHVTLSPDHIRVLQGLPLEEFESRAGIPDDALLELAVFADLKRLRLHNTSLTDAGLRAVVGLGRLEELRIVGSTIEGPGLEYLEGRDNLRVLDLSGGRLNDRGIESLVGLPALREVRLAGCPITDQGTTILAQIDGLETLDLSGTAVTDASLRFLKKHPTLKELILSDTRTTADWVRDFERGTPNCRVTWSPQKAR